MKSISRIGLGTVQFGIDYGVSNTSGRPNNKEVEKILHYVNNIGIRYLDTAPTYGEAELLIGRYLPVNHNIKIITKTPMLNEIIIEPWHKDYIIRSIEESLRKLKVEQIYALLIHKIEDLTKKGWQYFLDALIYLKERGLVSKLGASIYDRHDLEIVSGCFNPDIIQLPFNYLDRRLVESGDIAKLHSEGVEIHARSVFLQGLLLMEPKDIPNSYEPLLNELNLFSINCSEQNISKQAACLDFVLSQQEISAAIIGVNSLNEIFQLEKSLGCLGQDIQHKKLSSHLDNKIIDPRHW